GRSTRRCTRRGRRGSARRRAGGVPSQPFAVYGPVPTRARCSGMMTAMAAPLEGLRIVDCSRIVAGPLATQIFSDYGAEVIKVEQPRVGDDSRAWAPPRAPDGQATYFFAVNRGKESIAIDLKHPRGKALVVELARRGDVLVENFTPGTMERLGLGYAALRVVNPRLVYCSVSRFGATRPHPGPPGYHPTTPGVPPPLSTTPP